MSDVNRVLLTGRLTREPELRETAGGTAVLNFGLASNDRVKNQQTGEYEDRPNFVDCQIFGKRASALSAFLVKGMQVTVEGRLRYSSWEKDGQKRSKLEVVVDELVLPPAGDRQQAAPQEPAYQEAPQQGYQPQAYQAPPSQRMSPAAMAGREVAGNINYGGQRVDMYYEDEDIPF